MGLDRRYALGCLILQEEINPKQARLRGQLLRIGDEPQIPRLSSHCDGTGLGFPMLRCERKIRRIDVEVELRHEGLRVVNERREGHVRRGLA